MATEITQLFPLAHFGKALEGFRVPQELFDPHGAWVNAYDLWECSQGSRKIGALRIERTLIDRERAQLQVTYRKAASGGLLRATEAIECKTDTLATPVRWQTETVVHDAQGEPLEETRLAETGEAGARVLRVMVGGTPTRTPVNPPLACAWGLFDAVQRAPDDLNQAFTLIDRLNSQVKPEQRLTYRTSETVELGGTRVWHEEKRELERGTVYRPVAAREGATAVPLRAFDHVGRGLVPTVYWVDDRGRLLFVLSGLIGCVYNAEAQT
jgi:hypothetical protein